MHDFHTHFIPEAVMEWLKENKGKVRAKWIEKNGKTFFEVNGKWMFLLKDSFLNFSQYKDELKEAGVTHAVTSPIPQLFMYDFEPAITKELASVYNESLAQLHKENSAFLSALGTVPLNNPEQA